MNSRTHSTKQNGIQVVITGGTIDFHFDPAYEIESKSVDLLVPRKTSIVPYFLQERVKVAMDEIQFSRACLKDSREIDDDDRANILVHVVKSPFDRVLIVHGIANMDRTITYLEENKVKFEGKAVGVVGSRMPLSEYRSDGGFQLGYAMARMQAYKEGLHSFHPDEVKEQVEATLEDVVFLITGGTIDSYFKEQSDTAQPYEHSRIPLYFDEVLDIKPVEPAFVFKEICMKDSRQLSEAEIRLLIQEAQNQGHKNKIVTAGTYALPDLAGRFELMMARQELPGSKYVFVGAMLPDDVILNDGWYNVGYSLGKMDTLENAVHVSMHAWITPPGNVMKQLQEAKFLLYDQSLRK